MADIRLYAQITLDFAENPKIEGLSDTAFRQFIEILLWSRRQLTDGFITESSARKRFTPESLQELTTNHPTKPSLLKVDGGYLIHDFAEHQTTNADIEAKREAAKINGAKGGRPRKETQEETQTETQTETQNKPNENPTGFENESQKKPENKAQSTEVKLTSIEVTNALAKPAPRRKKTATTEDFDKFWEIYPVHKDKPKAVAAFTKALQLVDLETILEGARRHRDDPNRQPDYTKHPATWLNAAAWGNDPEPPRRQQKTYGQMKAERSQAAGEAWLAITSQPQTAISWESEWNEIE